MAELHRGFLAVHEVCDAAELQALRQEHPLPEWIGKVRAAIGGGVSVRWVGAFESEANSAAWRIQDADGPWEG
jgi:hypothetical protein